MNAQIKPLVLEPSDAELLADEAQYCSFGDTVHYVDPPKIFRGAEGSYLYDSAGVPFLDLQMWYSAVNFGYRNPRLNEVLKRQIDLLPQVASQYLHPTKIQLAKEIAVDAEQKFGLKGRVRRRFGHFGDRAMFIPFPYPFRRPKGLTPEEYSDQCVRQFARLFETEYNGVWDPKVGQAEYAAFYVEPIQGTGGYVIPPMNFFRDLKKVLDQYGILMVVDEIQMGFWRTGKLWSIEHFGVDPDIIVFGKALTNGLNPLSGLWAREELINPTIFPPGSTHSTFNSNPLGTALGLEVLRMGHELNYAKTVPEKGAYFLAGLRDLQKRHVEIGDVDGLGLALRAEICTDDGFSPNKALLDRMVDIGLAGDLVHKGKPIGLVLDVGGWYKNVITFAPSLDISYEEIDLGISLLDQLLTRAKRIS